jgi:hypothetical protein
VIGLRKNNRKLGIDRDRKSERAESRRTTANNEYSTYPSDMERQPLLMRCRDDKTMLVSRRQDGFNRHPQSVHQRGIVNPTTPGA